MRAMKKLRSLSIDWQVEEEFDHDCAQAWQTTFFGTHFADLEDIRLVSMETPRTTILKFLVRHASTVKRLVWNDDLSSTEESHWTNNVTEEPPSWREVITSLRNDMTKLEACEIQDDTDLQQLYVGGFKPVLIPPRDPVSAPKLLELYVLGKMPWPMKDDNPSTYRGWKPKHAPQNEEFDAYTREQLDYFYSDEWETDKEDGDSTSSDDSVNVSDDFEDEDDFDDDDDLDDEFGEQAMGYDPALLDALAASGMTGAQMLAALGLTPGNDDEWEDEMDVDEES
jgi:hypothetical protein